MIIEDHYGELPPSRSEGGQRVLDASGTCQADEGQAELATAWPGLSAVLDMYPDAEALVEESDEVPPLPSRARLRQLRPTRAPTAQLSESHIVLLLDASGSMRIRDVEEEETRSGNVLSRMDAAHICAVDFIERHAQRHPGDIFSVVTISQTATLVFKGLDGVKAVEALKDVAFHAAGDTMYRPALAEAMLCLDSFAGCSAGHLVMLSDGRPSDTKRALWVFQEEVVWGRFAGTRLHGIAFGGTVESFAPLQQLACISGGTFVLSKKGARGLCDAFTSVATSITSIKESCRSSSAPSPPQQRLVRRVNFELPELGVFGKKGVLRFRAKRITFQYNGRDFQRQEWVEGPVERRMRPYMRGGMRLVFGFRDAKVISQSQGWMVAKTSRFDGAPLNSAAVVEAHVKSTAVARYFARQFNERAAAAVATARETKGRDSRMPTLIFVPCFAYTAEVSTATSEASTACGVEEPTVFAAERYLPGVFLKYNSNNGYVSEDMALHHDVVQAFLHFTFEASGGAIAVTDLQGVAREKEVLLTDPQVLSTAGGDYGPGDLGARGLKACLTAHRCGASCKRLGLTPLRSSALRRLEAVVATQCAASNRQAPASSARSASELSTGSWEHLGAEAVVAAVVPHSMGDWRAPATPARSASELSTGSWDHLRGEAVVTLRPGCDWRVPASPARSASELSIGSWDQLGVEAAAPLDADWAQRSNQHFLLSDAAQSEEGGIRSSQASASSWVHLLDT